MGTSNSTSIARSTYESNQPLHDAAQRGDVNEIQRLLRRGIDVNVEDVAGWPPLFYAALGGHVDAMRCLVEKGADVSVADEEGWTALSHAAIQGRVDAMAYLVDELGVDVYAKDTYARTLLQLATRCGRLEAIQYVFDKGVDVNAKDVDGRSALSVAVFDFVYFRTAADHRSNTRHSQLRQYQTVRLLCELGAVLDDTFNEDFKSLDEAENGDEVTRWKGGLCVCASHWIDQRKRGDELLIDVAEETVRLGKDSVKFYLSSMAAAPTDITRRRKICVCGASGAGKTSMVKSLHLKSSHLVDEDDRTIGIDLFSMEFAPSGESKYNVTFWDFAGQDIYQVAHSLFFSKRTLYLLCVDMEKYAKVIDDDCIDAAVRSSWMQANLFRWVHLILARQPDAEFVVVCSKTDTVSDEQVEKLLDELNRELKQWVSTYVDQLDDSADAMATLKSVKELEARTKLRVNVTSDVALTRLRQQVCDEVTRARERAFVMPALYTSVLNAIEAMRLEAPRSENIAERVRALVMPSQALVEMLTSTSSELSDREDGAIRQSRHGLREALNHITDRVRSLAVSSSRANRGHTALGISGLSERDCRTILKTLHDLGDILWYQQRFSDNATSSGDIVILDPVLVLDAVREVVNHTHSTEDVVGGLVRHSLLATCPMWRALIDQSHDSVLFFKKLLQYFNLAYPAGSVELEWDSDLIVPVYWRARPLTGEIVTWVTQPISDPSLTQRASWQYTLPAHVSEAIFDQYVVQSYERDVDRRVASDLFSVSAGDWAVTVRRTAGVGAKKSSKPSSEDVVRIDVVSATTETCWDRMEWFVTSMEEVLSGFPGVVRVGRHIIRSGVGGKDVTVDVARVMKSVVGEDCRQLDLETFTVIRDKMVKKGMMK